MFYELIFRAGPFPPSPSASQPCFFMRQWAGFETNPVIGSFDPSTSLRFAQGSLSSGWVLIIRGNWLLCRQMKKILGILSTAALLIISGCGGSPSADDANEMVLQHSLGVKITGLDPADMRDVYSLIVSSQIFESLYQYHYLKRPYELEPLLAEERPQISDDKLTYTIKIKREVYFQDDACFEGGEGRELKAEDFIYSIKRVANIKNLSQNWSLFDGRIVGLDEFREYTKGCKSRADVDYSREVEGLQAPDDYTLVIRLKRPWPQFVGTALADRVTAPVAKEAVDYYGTDIISHPVGTGPFKLKQWRRGSYIELVRNENFRA